jgi:uncharacterized protein with HEPN domain
VVRDDFGPESDVDVLVDGSSGMRHKIVHHYIEIDVSVVWDTATNDLPSLIALLEKFTPPEPPSA